MNFSKWMGPLALCAGCSFAGLAQAENEGWYVVAFGGESSAQGISQSAQDQQLLDLFASVGLTPVNVTTSLDDSDTGFGLAAGYQVNRNFAAELAYVDLGEISYDAAGTFTDGLDTLDTDIAVGQSASGPVFSLLGIVPIGNRFSVYGRLGIALMDVEAKQSYSAVDITDPDNVVADSGSVSTQRSNGVYGIGGEFSFNGRFGIRLEWDRFADVGSEDLTGEGDVDLISLGLRYNFR
jgi:OOP family OmpA-OmpF porin